MKVIKCQLCVIWPQLTWYFGVQRIECSLSIWWFVSQLIRIVLECGTRTYATFIWYCIKYLAHNTIKHFRLINLTHAQAHALMHTHHTQHTHTHKHREIYRDAASANEANRNLALFFFVVGPKIILGWLMWILSLLCLRFVSFAVVVAVVVWVYSKHFTRTQTEFKQTAGKRFSLWTRALAKGDWLTSM